MNVEASRAARVTARAREVLEKSGIQRNPYLQTLEDGSMTLEVPAHGLVLIEVKP